MRSDIVYLHLQSNETTISSQNNEIVLHYMTLRFQSCYILPPHYHFRYISLSSSLHIANNDFITVALLKLWSLPIFITNGDSIALKNCLH